MVDSTQILLLGLVAALGYMTYHGLRRDPREPTFLPSKIPVVGHALGMLWNGLPYWGRMANENTGFPIFTLDMFFMKVYVISSTEIVRLIQRNDKTVSFDPLLNISTVNFSGIKNKRTLHLMLDKQSGGEGLNAEIMHAMTPTLIGEHLDRMNSIMMRTVERSISALEKSTDFDLYRWLRNIVTAASTEATYGPKNPYKDPEIVDAFWDFEYNLNSLLPNFLPWLTARKAYNGRGKVARAIYEYLEQNGIEGASELERVRYTKSMEREISHEDFAQLEVPMLIGLVSNTVPALFWALFELYSQPELLDEIREEIKQNALSVSENGTYRVDITAIKERCPLTLSTYQEILRWRTTTTPTRMVVKDTILSDQYLLKEGSFVSMPGSTLGRRPDVWGESAGVFNPRRFMKPDPSKDESRKNERRRTGGFMPFGISPIICPGRHFASSEVLGISAMMIIRYDLDPAGGVWKAPSTDTMSMVSIMGAVKGEFPVSIRTRQEYQGTKWGFHCEEGKGQFTLAVG
ncbi:hypothetical protein N7532_001700 [Penicillium argentinense]|uniref:Cytochrome P450 n=1 Tax=Penicillium argentinense TaxID=1131581 RepID=A0A9W9KM15_9EURO|nr:uncharacterized protein N7532_001700 [Penicillium argentinense]KAJ5111165.1 hypothetical protein N7532_001700 [Penicillium argentinense]